MSDKDRQKKDHKRKDKKNKASRERAEAIDRARKQRLKGTESSER